MSFLINHETVIGIDNGNSAFLCALDMKTGKVEFHPVPIYEVGKHAVVDDSALYDIISSYPTPFVGYEWGNVQPIWQAKTNWMSGFNCAAVKVLLRQRGIPNRPFEAREWQAVLFQGLRGFAQVKDAPGPDTSAKKEKAGLHPTKILALEYCRNTYPTVKLRSSPREKFDSPDMADALCIATYTRSLVFRQPM